MNFAITEKKYCFCSGFKPASMIMKISITAFFCFWAFLLIGSSSIYAQEKTAQQLRETLISMQACKASLTHSECNLDILEPSLKSSFIRLHELRNAVADTTPSYSDYGQSSSTTNGECYNSSIQKPTPFMGNHGEVAILTDGSIWKVMHEYEYMYEYYPSVVACPERNLLIVDDKKLDAQNLSKSGSTVILSSIDGSWDGWSGDTIVRLLNGQIWEQVGASLSLSLGLGNEVFIYESSGRFFMMVDGETEAVAVERLK
jgi:hypothetical protein